MALLASAPTDIQVDQSRAKCNLITYQVHRMKRSFSYVYQLNNMGLLNEIRVAIIMHVLQNVATLRCIVYNIEEFPSNRLVDRLVAIRFSYFNFNCRSVTIDNGKR